MISEAAREREKKRAREYQKRRRVETPEAVKAEKRAYYERHREQVKAKAREWYAANKDHARKHARKKALAKLGTTPEDRARALASQGGRCAICRAPFRSSRSTHTDHDHDTGKFRALLCARCNNGLGVVEREGGRWLWGAMAYLVKHGHPEFTWAYEREDVA